MTTDPASLARTYFTAWKEGDFATIRSILSDDATFRGPLGQADGAEECVQGLTGMSKIITDIVISRIFVDGDDVLTWYDLHTSIAPPAPTANWSTVAGGKIRTIRATFDARPFTAGGGPDS